MSRHYRILILSPDFPPANNPESLVNGKFALALLHAGHSIHVICRKRSSATFTKYWSALEPMVSNLAWDYPRSRVWRFILRMIFFFRTGVWCFDNMCFPPEYREGCRLLQEEKYDVILVRCGVFSSLISAVALSKKFHIPFVININDPFLPYPPAGNRFWRWLCRLQYRCLGCKLRRAAALTFPSQRLMDYELRQSGLAHEAVGIWRVVPHIALPDSIVNQSGALTDGGEKASSENCRNDEIHIVYAGGLGPKRSLKPLLWAAGDFRRQNPDVRFRLIFAGTSPQPEEFKMIEEFGLQACFDYLGRVSYEQALSLQQNADINLIIEADLPEGIFLPSKLVDAAQVGKPILALSPRIGVLRDLNERFHFGEVADNKNRAEVYASFSRLLHSIAAGNSQPTKNTEFIQYLQDSPVQIYEDILAKIVSSPV